MVWLELPLCHLSPNCFLSSQHTLLSISLPTSLLSSPPAGLDSPRAFITLHSSYTKPFFPNFFVILGLFTFCPTINCEHHRSRNYRIAHLHIYRIARVSNFSSIKDVWGSNSAGILWKILNYGSYKLPLLFSSYSLLLCNQFLPLTTMLISTSGSCSFTILLISILLWDRKPQVMKGVAKLNVSK